MSRVLGFDDHLGEYVRAPVKLPGWSQPSVPGLQALIVETANAKAIARDLYMMAMMMIDGLGGRLFNFVLDNE